MPLIDSPWPLQCFELNNQVEAELWETTDATARLQNKSEHHIQMKGLIRHIDYDPDSTRIV